MCREARPHVDFARQQVRVVAAQLEHHGDAVRLGPLEQRRELGLDDFAQAFSHADFPWGQRHVRLHDKDLCLREQQRPQGGLSNHLSGQRALLGHAADGSQLLRYLQLLDAQLEPIAGDAAEAALGRQVLQGAARVRAIECILQRNPGSHEQRRRPRETRRRGHKGQPERGVRAREGVREVASDGFLLVVRLNPGHILARGQGRQHGAQRVPHKAQLALVPELLELRGEVELGAGTLHTPALELCDGVGAVPNMLLGRLTNAGGLE
mmetsp:Transcript_69081/g.198126  ORF Transcript_69081/g.198126 Transcript_69081/m.198126 type:complete len:266 (+) Transcript_69081:188-985(+)